MSDCLFPGADRCGMTAGYIAGCRNDACRVAAAKYQKELRARKRGYKTAAYILEDGTEVAGRAIPGDWLDDAACRGMDVTIWFPTAGQDYTEAKRICSGCPVRKECRALAVRNREEFGVWAGVSMETPRARGNAA